jgi:hypothetical protein
MHGPDRRAARSTADQNRLRVIGRRYDELGLRELAIMEAAHGIVAQAIVPHDRRVEVLEFADAHFAHLISEAVTTRRQRGPTPDHALLPTGN